MANMTVYEIHMWKIPEQIYICTRISILNILKSFLCAKYAEKINKTQKCNRLFRGGNFNNACAKKENAKINLVPVMLLEKALLPG